jgi:hypothetical protein
MRHIFYRFEYLPYQFVAIMSLAVAFFVGALLQGGADYLRDMAYKQGQIDLVRRIPIDVLTTIDVKEHEV